MPRDPNRTTPPRTRGKPGGQTSGASWLHQCSDWPLYEVLLSEQWNKEGELASMLVARQSPRSGKIAAASFLVDLGCTGVRSAFVRICQSPADYARRLRNPLLDQQQMAPSDLNLVARIVAEGLAYAEGLGLAPDPEYRQAARLLARAEPEACSVDIPLGGKDGKPRFIARPGDDVDQVMAALERTVGLDGFSTD